MALDPTEDVRNVARRVFQHLVDLAPGWPLTPRVILGEYTAAERRREITLALEQLDALHARGALQDAQRDAMARRLLAELAGVPPEALSTSGDRDRLLMRVGWALPKVPVAQLGPIASAMEIAAGTTMPEETAAWVQGLVGGENS